MKKRVVIRAFVARRDVCVAALLKELLERRGYEVMITSVRSFSIAVRFWQPDIVIVNTSGQTRFVKEVSPHSTIVFLDAEGYTVLEKSRAVLWNKDPQSYDDIDQILLWGGVQLKAFDLYAPDLDTSKISVVGNPKLDFVRYKPLSQEPKKPSNSVGFVARFPRINQNAGVPTIRNLHEDKTLDMTISMCRSYHAFFKAIKAVLETTDLNVSIRPHPFEALEGYYDIVLPALGKEYADRIEVDESMLFSEWARKQKAIVAPTSTSFLEAYLMGIPVFNLDFLANTEEYNRMRAEVAEAWQGSANKGESLEDMCAMLQGDIPPPEKNDQIEEQLNDHCDWGRDGSATLRAVDAIVAFYEKNGQPSPVFRLPTFIIHQLDNISFRRAMKRDRLHHNFNYKSGYHELPAFYGEVADSIEADRDSNQRVKSSDP